MNTCAHPVPLAAPAGRLGWRVSLALMHLMGPRGAGGGCQTEGQLATLTAAYSACERIKTTMVPRSHTLFTRLFVYVFITLFPFCVVSGFIPSGNTYLVIPVTLIVATAFALADKSATIIEHPFANLPNDVPLSALAIDLERDLRELLDELAAALPPVAVPVRGYLY
jgi:ion channel-forming bestrophin family protein